MSNWQNAKMFGVVQVNPSSNGIKLFYDRFNSLNLPSPNNFMVVESAMWQGEQLIVRGRNQYGEQNVYAYDGEYSYQRIF